MGNGCPCSKKREQGAGWERLRNTNRCVMVPGKSPCPGNLCLRCIRQNVTFDSLPVCLWLFESPIAEKEKGTVKIDTATSLRSFELSWLIHTRAILVLHFLAFWLLLLLIFSTFLLNLFFPSSFSSVYPSLCISLTWKLYCLESSLLNTFHTVGAISRFFPYCLPLCLRRLSLSNINEVSPCLLLSQGLV